MLVSFFGHILFKRRIKIGYNRLLLNVAKFFLILFFSILIFFDLIISINIIYLHLKNIGFKICL